MVTTLSEKLSAYKVDVICVVDEEVNKKSFADVFTQDNPFEQKWFFLLVNNQFPICHPLSKEYALIKENTYATTAIFENDEGHLIPNLYCRISLASTVSPSQKSEYVFSKQLHSTVVAHLNLTSQSQSIETVLITAEWVCNENLYWITSQPFVVNDTKSTFIAIMLSDDTPSGNWHVNIYLQDRFAGSASFSVKNLHSAAHPSAFFVDVKI
jgi:hypothetical protein